MRIPSMNGAGNYTALQNFLKSMNNTNSTANDPLQNVYQNMMSKDTFTMSQEAMSARGSGRRVGGGNIAMDESMRQQALREMESSSNASAAKDSGWRHHDNGMTESEYRLAALTALSTDAVIQEKPKSIDEYNSLLKTKIEIILDHEGIKLKDDEKFNISMKDGKYKISGLDDKEKQNKIEKALNEMHIIEKDFTFGVNTMIESTTYLNSDYAKSAKSYQDSLNRAGLIAIKDTIDETLKAVTGVDIDVSKLSLNEDGSISGYPKELEWIFKGDYNAAPLWNQENDMQKYQMARQVMHDIKLILAAGYDNIPDMDESDVKMSYSNKGMEIY